MHCPQRVVHRPQAPVLNTVTRESSESPVMARPGGRCRLSDQQEGLEIYRRCGTNNRTFSSGGLYRCHRTIPDAVRLGRGRRLFDLCILEALQTLFVIDQDGLGTTYISVTDDA